MKTLIAVPCMDKVDTPFFLSVVGMETEGDVQYATAISSLIYDARNHLAKIAVDGGFDRVLWLDSDMVFEKDLFKRLSARLDEGYDIVSGLYFTRKPPIHPVAYKDFAFVQTESGLEPTCVPYKDYPKNEMFQVAGVGFGCVMAKAKVFLDVFNEFGRPFSPNDYFGEDISFCQRATALGYQIYVDPTVKLGHVGYTVFNEEVYERLNNQ